MAEKSSSEKAGIRVADQLGDSGALPKSSSPLVDVQRDSTGRKGKLIRAVRDIKEGSSVLVEHPFRLGTGIGDQQQQADVPVTRLSYAMPMPRAENPTGTPTSTFCCNCHRSLLLTNPALERCVTSAGLTAAMLFTPPPSSVVACAGGGCGEAYCGEACRRDAWRGWHGAVHACQDDRGGGDNSDGDGGECEGRGDDASCRAADSSSKSQVPKTSPSTPSSSSSSSSSSTYKFNWWDDARGAVGALVPAYAELLAHCVREEEHAHLGALRMMLACAARSADVCPGLVSDDESAHVRKHIDEVRASRPYELVRSIVEPWCRGGAAALSFASAEFYQRCIGRISLNATMVDPESPWSVSYATMSKLRNESSKRAGLRALSNAMESAVGAGVDLDAYNVRACCAVYDVQSCCNHSCDPNVSIGCPVGTDRMTLTAMRDIAVGEEITFAYVDTSLPVHERRAQLFRSYLFECECDRCARELEAEVERLRRENKKGMQ